MSEGDRSKSKKGIIGAAVAVVAGLFILARFAANAPGHDSGELQRQLDAQPSFPGAPPQPLAVAASPPLPHNYAMEDDGEYGYVQPVSEDDKKAGTGTNPLAMFRYLGKLEDGTYQVAQVNESAQAVMSCKDPCDYIKATLMVDGKKVGNARILPAGNNLGTSVMEDARSGVLKVYQAKQAPPVPELRTPEPPAPEPQAPEK